MYCIVLQVQRLNRSATLAQNLRGQALGPSSCVFPAQADQAGVGHIGRQTSSVCGVPLSSWAFKSLRWMSHTQQLNFTKRRLLIPLFIPRSL